MITAKNILLILVLGAVWGLAEVFGKHLLTGLGDASIWLAVWALLVLSIGRGHWNKIGSSTLIGLVAAAFKFVGPSTNYCHLLGIASLGLIFDLFASSLARRPGWWRHALVGLLTAYGARAFFVLYSVHIAHFERWVEGGTPMALEHVLGSGSGSAVAVAALLLVPMGFSIGEKTAAMLSDDPAGKALTAENR